MLWERRARVSAASSDAASRDFLYSYRIALVEASDVLIGAGAGVFSCWRIRFADTLPWPDEEAPETNQKQTEAH